MKLKLIRFLDNGETTLGRLIIKLNYTGKLAQYNTILRYFTVEPSWKDNQQFKSCIPVGVYTVEPHESPKHKKCLVVKGVLNREYILIHAGNTYLDTKGCILVGLERGDKIYNRKHCEHNIGVIYSKLALDKILSLIKKPCELEIVNKIKKRY